MENFIFCAIGNIKTDCLKDVESMIWCWNKSFSINNLSIMIANYKTTSLNQNLTRSRGVLRKKMFLEILQNSYEKRRPWYRCFPVNFAKFLRTPFFCRTPLDDCFCLTADEMLSWMKFLIQIQMTQILIHWIFMYGKMDEAFFGCIVIVATFWGSYFEFCCMVTKIDNSFLMIISQEK